MCRLATGFQESAVVTLSPSLAWAVVGARDKHACEDQSTDWQQNPRVFQSWIALLPVTRHEPSRLGKRSFMRIEIKHG